MDEVLGFVLGAICIITGRVILRTASVLQLKCEPFCSDAYRMRSAAGALWYTEDHKVVVTQTGQLIVGILVYVAVAAFLFKNLVV